MNIRLTQQDLEIISQFTDFPVTRTDANKPFSDLGIEPGSLDATELIMRIERKYGINISDKDFETHNTPKKLFTFVKGGSTLLKSARIINDRRMMYSPKGGEYLSSVVIDAPWWDRKVRPDKYKTTARADIRNATLEQQKNLQDTSVPIEQRAKTFKEIGANPTRGMVQFRERRPLLFGRKAFDQRAAKPVLDVGLVTDKPIHVQGIMQSIESTYNKPAVKERASTNRPLRLHLLNSPQDAQIEKAAEDVDPELVRRLALEYHVGTFNISAAKNNVKTRASIIGHPEDKSPLVQLTFPEKRRLFRKNIPEKKTYLQPMFSPTLGKEKGGNGPAVVFRSYNLD